MGDCGKDLCVGSNSVDSGKAGGFFLKSFYPDYELFFKIQNLLVKRTEYLIEDCSTIAQ